MVLPGKLKKPTGVALAAGWNAQRSKNHLMGCLGIQVVHTYDYVCMYNVHMYLLMFFLKLMSELIRSIGLFFKYLFF